jgi:hypothetical protein
MRRRLTLLSSFFAAIIGAPLAAFALDTNSFGPIVPQSGECLCSGRAPDWGCVLQVFQNLLNAGVSFSILLVTLFIAWGGFMYITNSTNPKGRTEARNRILNAILGLIVIFGSWIIVDTIMKVLYNPNTAFVDAANHRQTFGPWNALLNGTGDDQCVKENKSANQLLNNGSIASIFQGGNFLNPGVGNSSSSGNSGGSCKVAKGGPCSVAALQGTCFANRAEAASSVCNLESAGGNTSVESGSDRLNGGSGPSYSIGLWQINLTTSPVAGLNCPDAFTAKCQKGALVGPSHPGWCNSSIKNQDLYNRCAAAAKIPQNNTETACKLYNNAHGFQPWTYSANKCSVPLH